MTFNPLLLPGMVREDHDGWHEIASVEVSDDAPDPTVLPVVEGYWLRDPDGEETFMGVAEVWGTWRKL